MLDDLDEQIRIWVAEEPGVTGVEILRRIKALHPIRLTNKHARTVQRAVKRWRAEAARRVIIESAVTIGGVTVRPVA
jgi:hypothetical protein